MDQKESTLQILTNWIVIAKRHQLSEKISDIWLLRDFAYGNIWSEEFYKGKAERAFIALSSLDDKKPEVKMVSEFLLPIIKEYMVDRIKPVGPVATSRDRSDRNRVGLA